MLKSCQQNAVPRDGAASSTHLLHFEPLAADRVGLDVPCDPQGCVRLDVLGAQLRNDYFFARTLIGRLFAAPIVRCVARG